MMRVTVQAPPGWTAVSIGTDRMGAIEAAVDQMTAGLDRDSDAVSRHWLRDRLVSASETPPGARCELVGLLISSSPVAGVTLPVSAQILRLDDGVMSNEPMRDLAVLAAQDPSAKPLTVGGGLVLRTHEVRDMVDAVRTEVDRADVGDQDRAAILDGLATVPSVRVQYYLPGIEQTPWHIIAFTALLGADDPELVDLYMELSDALIQSMRVEPDST